MDNYTKEMNRQAGCFREVYSPQGRYVNDHCFVRLGKTYHLFHITGPAGRKCYDRDSEISFGHATSADLNHWKAEDDALYADSTVAHEKDHIFAPYVQENAGRYFLFYAGINRTIQQESMCLATSGDLYKWEKFPHNPVFRPSRYWAEYGNDAGLWSCCRDPHVIRHPELGFILYFVTWHRGTCGQKVTIGAAVSGNLVSWQDAGPVIIREFASGHSTTSMESPCVLERNGLYYLFYKHRDETRLVISDNPLQFNEREDKWFSIAHASEIFESGGRWYISSCSRDLLDIRHEKTGRTRGLFLACLEWSGEVPSIVPFIPAGDN